MEANYGSITDLIFTFKKSTPVSTLFPQIKLTNDLKQVSSSPPESQRDFMGGGGLGSSEEC